MHAGSAVATYPKPQNTQTVSHPIVLSATVSSKPMDATCRALYKKALTDNLINMARLINFLICNQTMCPYMAGRPGSGVLLNATQRLFNQVLYVAIDTSSMDSAVSLDVDSSVN